MFNKLRKQFSSNQYPKKASDINFSYFYNVPNHKSKLHSQLESEFKALDKNNAGKYLLHVKDKIKEKIEITNSDKYNTLKNLFRKDDDDDISVNITLIEHMKKNLQQKK